MADFKKFVGGWVIESLSSECIWLGFCFGRPVVYSQEQVEETTGNQIQDQSWSLWPATWNLTVHKYDNDQKNHHNSHYFCNLISTWDQRWEESSDFGSQRSILHRQAADNSDLITMDKRTVGCLGGGQLGRTLAAKSLRLAAIFVARVERICVFNFDFRFHERCSTISFLSSQPTRLYEQIVSSWFYLDDIMDSSCSTSYQHSWLFLTLKRRLWALVGKRVFIL